MEQLIDILKYYLDYPDLSSITKDCNTLPTGCIGKSIDLLSSDFDFAALSSYKFALLGVTESRNTKNEDCNQAPDKIREAFYQLYPTNFNMHLIDLGNLKMAKTANDTHYAMRDLVEALLENQIIPIIIGGGQDLTYPQFKAYQHLYKKVNLTAIDSYIDLGEIGEPFSARSYMGKILTEDSDQLFNFANLAGQQCLVSPANLDMMDKLYFDVHRLGEIHTNIEQTEPALRDSNLVSFDISAVRMAEAPGSNHATPNGLYGNEACQLAWYAGISENVSSFGIYEVNPMLDERNRTSALAAQLIWYFIDGYYHRVNDFPLFDETKHELLSYDIDVMSHSVTFVFCKSSGRWWMKIPMTDNSKNEDLVIACSYEDYKLACEGEVPNRLWRMYQKIN